MPPRAVMEERAKVLYEWYIATRRLLRFLNQLPPEDKKKAGIQFVMYQGEATVSAIERLTEYIVKNCPQKPKDHGARLMASNN